jgi:hypothetical protein
MEERVGYGYVWANSVHSLAITNYGAYHDEYCGNHDEFIKLIQTNFWNKMQWQ